MKQHALACLLGMSIWSLACAAKAQAATAAWEAGMVLDATANSRALSLGARSAGLGLGHSDLLVRGPLGEWFSAEANLGLHTAEPGKLEHHLENAWLQSRALPLGLQVRAGRFASQIGYLNELHSHTDDFTERPLLYRGLLGGHWYGDGLRLNWTAPTSLYVRLGAEKYVSSSTLNFKVGDDWGRSHSWQWGLSRVQHAHSPEVPEHDPATAHAHDAVYQGRQMWLSDLVWKWAPDGNNRNQQVRLIWEFAQVSHIHPQADADQKHQASSLGAVWRFRPGWEVGARSDWLRVAAPENSGAGVVFGSGRLREHALMVAYKPTHQQTLRLQWTQQGARGVNDEGEAIFANPARRSWQLQYVMGWGAHGAHSY